MKKLLTGNEAIAEGIIESEVEVVTGYPGTPSTEVILTLLPRKEELGIYIEWSTNEKVAFEIAEKIVDFSFSFGKLLISLMQHLM